jgi:integrase
LSNRTKNKLLALLHGVLRRAQKVYGLPRNPVAEVERHPQRTSGDIQVFSVEEVYALARAASSEQDASISLTAAFTGLRRGELVALRWRDVDFAAASIRVRASYAGGALTTPKSGRVRTVPMAPDVAETLAPLGQRGHTTRDDDVQTTMRYLHYAPRHDDAALVAEVFRRERAAATPRERVAGP